MVEVSPSSTASQPAAAAATAPSGHGGGLFHELLSDLNPLQYIPIVGTIYRAITGDQGNSDLRFVASLGTSFVLGGPIGVAITAGEKIAGIDPERMALNAARHLFHIGHDDTPAAAPAAKPEAPPDTPAVSTQLAFAVNSHGMSADDLNGLELQRLNA